MIVPAIRTLLRRLLKRPLAPLAVLAGTRFCPRSRPDGAQRICLFQVCQLWKGIAPEPK
jgi:hypothetical protein